MPSGTRKLLLAAPLVALLAGWATSSTLTDAPAVEAPVVEAVAPLEDMAFAASNCTYYNNAQHSMIVGQFGYDCCNNPVAWGRKTAYYDCGGCFPCFPPPR